MLNTKNMEYRNLGNTGLMISAISFGTWTNVDSSYQQNLNIIKMCLQNGINYFDTAQSYANGQGEVTLGRILKQIGQPRQNLVISTKIWTSQDPDINSKANTNKKHIREGIKSSLKRLQLEYVDIVLAHTFDENTPLEQICRAFNQIIEEGYAFYWGTSSWDAFKVIEAMEICQQYNFHKPICAQNQYNMINRKQIQVQYRTLFQRYGYGLTAYSPLLGGYLTGKYIEQDPEQGRFASEKTGNSQKSGLKSIYTDNLDLKDINQKLSKVKQIAKQDLQCELLHLAIAWVVNFQYTSTALIGARSVKQLQSTLKTIQVFPKLTKEIEEKVNNILQTHPQVRYEFKKIVPDCQLRPVKL